MKYYHFIGIVLLIITEIIKYFFSCFPGFVEQYYTRSIFIVINYCLSAFSFVLILPGLFLIPIIYFATIIFSIKSFKSTLSKFLWILNSMGVLYFIFYLVWGFNYYRLPIDNGWKYKSVPFTVQQLESEYEETTVKLVKIRNLLSDSSQKISISNQVINERAQGKILQKNLRQWLKNNEFPTQAPVSIRYNIPKGFFLHFSTAGMYFPFSGEGNVDPGLHPLQFTSVMAHEMAHGYGFADEGTCNFLAYICHHNDKNSWVAYTATMGYWRYLASNVRRISPDFFNRKINEIPTGLKLDLQEMQEFSNKYEDWMPQLQYKIYDAYLKGQGIKEGMLNYNKVIGLVLAYKAANPFIFDASSSPK